MPRYANSTVEPAARDAAPRPFPEPNKWALASPQGMLPTVIILYASSNLKRLADFQQIPYYGTVRRGFRHGHKRSGAAGGSGAKGAGGAEPPDREQPWRIARRDRLAEADAGSHAGH